MARERPSALPSDREVLALAVPALGALAAEPLYVLGDTAIVGHLGTLPLAGLALGGLLVSEAVGFCTFLEYGTTARAARLYGAGDHEAALDAGVQATWIAVGLGLLLVVLLELLAAPALHVLAPARVAARAQALRWMRIAILGAPFVLMTAAAQGWMRGFQNTRTPLVVIGVANLASIALSAFLIRGVGLGIEGSAIANVVAQAASGLAFGLLLVRRTRALRPSWERIRPQLRAGRELTLRTLGFFLAFTIALGVAASMGTPELGAQQIGFQLWILLALVLDATAIAAQALVGSLLGAGEVEAARALARRLILAGLWLGVGFAVLLAAGYDLIPRIFTSDPAVRAQAHVLWPWFVAMMPFNGIVFAVDGVFFGAGDLRFQRNVTLIAALGGYVPLSLATAALGLGLGGIWAGLSTFIVIRLVLGVLRFRSGRWLVAGRSLADEVALAA